MTHHSKEADKYTIRHESADIRRRFRMREGVAKYTFTVLFEALRTRGTYMRNTTIVLLGFPHENESSKAREAAHEFRSLLSDHGARVREFDSTDKTLSIHNASLRTILHGADAVVIAADHKVFRALRPREFRTLGIDVVVPTTFRDL